MKRTLIGALAVGLMLTLGACKKPSVEIKPDASATDETLFKEGEKLLKKDAEKARLYMRQLIESYPQSFYSPRAKLAIADSYFKEGDEANMILAAAEYTEFIRIFPNKPEAAYAQYQIGLSAYKSALKPGRDQQKTIQALAEFKKVLTLYPLSEQAKTARDGIKDCEERLAEHEYLIAQHYHRREAYKAAVARLTELLSTYPSYSGLDKVFFLLGAANQDWGKAEEAVPFLTKLVTDYPKSDLAAKAQKRLRQIQTAPKKPEKKEPGRSA